MNTIKTNFYDNDIKLTLTEEETAEIIPMTEKEIWKNPIDENFLGGFKNNILKQVATYDKLDNEYDRALEEREERPRQFPFESFFEMELSALLNNIQIVILDELKTLGGGSNNYLDLEEIRELREVIEMEIEIDKESIAANHPELF
ncbi:MAG: hypothetical protein U9R26_05020 [Campylobacterota bacterium]|nr:hypothetical protein [Campylobacterota bacterium]